MSEDGEEATWTTDLVVESEHGEKLKPPQVRTMRSFEPPQLSTTRSSNHRS